MVRDASTSTPGLRPLKTDHRTVTRAGIARMAALALLWGSGFLWIKVALRGFNPVQIVFVRLVLGFLVLAPLVLSRNLRFRETGERGDTCSSQPSSPTPFPTSCSG